jgi:hypothetical protein
MPQAPAPASAASAAQRRQRIFLDACVDPEGVGVIPCASM